MWKSIATAVLRYKYVFLFLLLALTAFFGWQGSKVRLGYEFSKAIPTDNPKYLAFECFNKIFNSSERTEVIANVLSLTKAFETRHNITLRMSGLPLIRTILSERIKREMKIFMIASIALSALILLLFFRSVSAMLLSLFVVGIGVVWSMGTIELMGYKISLLTALIPPLIIVIGVPNCIYFLNKFHSTYKETGDKREAIIQMISKMGIVTLFCN